MIRCFDITDFFLRNRGRCFRGWKVQKIRSYVLVNDVRRNIFAARDQGGRIAFSAIAWLEDARMILALDKAGESQFSWSTQSTGGDSILIADVAGERQFMREVLKQVMARWPDSPRKRLFTYRRGRITEIPWRTVHRLAHGFISKNS